MYPRINCRTHIMIIQYETYNMMHKEILLVLIGDVRTHKTILFLFKTFFTKNHHKQYSLFYIFLL
jgi:hypothetical protein